MDSDDKSEESLDDAQRIKRAKTLKSKNETKTSKVWVLKIVLMTFMISVALSFASETLTEKINILVAVAVLLFFIVLGVVFDMVGVAVTTADSKNFNSMAARKIKGARTSLWCISKAPVVSNFCNDVIGDISGVISGTMGAVTAVSVASSSGLPKLLCTVLITGLISSLTVGGKAFGKKIAIDKNNSIVFFVSKLMCIFIPERLFYMNK